MPEFAPANSLEQSLLDAQTGKARPSEFFAALHAAQVFVMVNQPLGDNGEWVEGTQLLVLESPDGTPVVAVFTAPERSVMWHEIATGFGHGLLVDFRWLLGGLVNDVGLAINPGTDVGLEMTPSMVKKLQDSVAGH